MLGWPGLGVQVRRHQPDDDAEQDVTGGALGAADLLEALGEQASCLGSDSDGLLQELDCFKQLIAVDARLDGLEMLDPRECASEAVSDLLHRCRVAPSAAI